LNQASEVRGKKPNNALASHIQFGVERTKNEQNRLGPSRGALVRTNGAAPGPAANAASERRACLRAMDQFSFGIALAVCSFVPIVTRVCVELFFL